MFSFSVRRKKIAVEVEMAEGHAFENVRKDLEAGFGLIRLVFGARDPKAGYCGSLGDLVRDTRLNHRLEVIEGVLEAECGDLLRRFFEQLRSR